MTHDSGRGLQQAICAVVFYTVDSAHAAMKELHGAYFFSHQISIREGAELSASIGFFTQGAG
jgi:hypothetical protein